MSTEEEKHLDDFVRRMVKDTGLEKPAPDLKRNIMQGIRSLNSRVAYKALIPKRGWVVLMSALAVFVAFVYYNPFEFKGLGFEIFPKDLAGIFGNPSRVTVCAVVVLGLMMCVQIVLLKRRLDQKYR